MTELVPDRGLGLLRKLASRGGLRPQSAIPSSGRQLSCVESPAQRVYSRYVTKTVALSSSLCATCSVTDVIRVVTFNRAASLFKAAVTYETKDLLGWASGRTCHILTIVEVNLDGWHPGVPLRMG